MQNTLTDSSGKARKNAAKKETTVTELLLAMLGGAVFANGELLGCFSPFSLAFSSCFSPGGRASAFVGAAVGAVAFGRVWQMLPYMAAMLASMLLEAALYAFGLRSGLRLKIAEISALVFGLDLLTSDLLHTPSIGFLLVVLDSVFSGAAVFLAHKLKNIAKARPDFSLLSSEDKAVLFCGFTLTVTALCSYSLWLFNFGIAFGAYFVICFSCRKKPSLCTVTATLAVIGACLFSPELSFCALPLGAAALLCPLCAPLGRAAQCLSALLASLLAMLLLGADINTFGCVLDISLAMAAFSFVKSRSVYSDAADVMEHYSELPSSLASGRLLMASGAMDSIKSSIESASAMLEREAPKDLCWISDRVTDELCKKCKGNMRCWQERFDDTAKAMSSTAYEFRKGINLTVSDLPSYLKENCIKCSEVTSRMNRLHEIYKSETRASRRFADMRSVLSGQLESTQLMLKQLGEEVASSSYSNSEKSKEIEELLVRAGMRFAKATVSANSSGAIRIEAYGKTEPAALSVTELQAEFEKRLDVKFSVPKIYRVKGQIRLLASQTARLRAIVKTDAKSRQSVSGDVCKSFEDGRGNVYVCLSDGMGSGERAFVDSGLACKLVTNLLQSGIEAQTALKIANAGLFVKSADESFATLDILKIDLFAARAEFVKAGAVASYIKRAGTVIKIDGASLPIGMLDSVSASVREAALKKGDFIVMVSDGAVQSKTDWLVPLLQKTEETDPEALARLICDFAKAAEESEDDITVAVIALCEN